MATAEQNALLAMQLMGAPFAQYNQQNDARTNLAFKLAAMQREEQLKRDLMAQEGTLRRDLATQGYDKSIELANMQGTREDKRNQATLDWHKSADAARESSADKRAAESERKQGADLDARESRALQAQFAQRYPEYALWAAKAGEEIKQRTDYETTPEGLGQLNADFAKAKDGAEKATRKAAAIPIEGNINRLVTEGAELRAAADAARVASDDDRARARTTAAQEIAKRIEGGQQYAGLPSSKKTRDEGLALLGRADSPKEARKKLGEAAWAEFEALQTNLLAGILASPERRAAASQAEQAWRNNQSNLDRFMQQVATMAGTNEFAAEAFTNGTNAIQRSLPAAPKTPPSFEEITPAPPGGGGSVIPKLDSTKSPTAQPRPLSGGMDGSAGRGNPLAMLGLGAPERSPVYGPRAVPIIDIPAPTYGPAAAAQLIDIQTDRRPVPVIDIPRPFYGPSAAPLIDIQTAPAPVPIIEIPPESSDPYQSFTNSSGSSLTDKLLSRPLEREVNFYEDIYQGKVPPDAQNRRLQALMQILHGGEYTNPKERAIARAKLYQLLGVTPGGN